MAYHHLRNGFFGGWNVPRPGHDRCATVFMPTATKVPDTFELPGIASIPKIDQAAQGSCTGHGTAGAVMYEQHKQGEKIVVPSRSMIYYDARIPEHTTSYDSGATVADAVAGVAKYGVCPDSEFPYSDQICDKAPSKQDYVDGLKQAALSEEKVNFGDLNATLASEQAIVFGFTVYMSMMTTKVAKTGIVPLPGKNDEVDGGHCTWLFGFNMTDEPWTSPSGLVYPARCKAARNSWRNADGTWWGDQGDFFLPQKYFDEGLTSDHWVIRSLGAKS